jgi:hypothetical protein
MLRRALWVGAADIIMLVAAFYVVQDLQWRSAYASAAINRCGGATCSYTPSFSYGILTQIFTMTGNSVQLSSPVTLDWIQALVYVLILLNGWLIYTWARSRRAAGPPVTVANKSPT